MNDAKPDSVVGLFLFVIDGCICRYCHFLIFGVYC